MNRWRSDSDKARPAVVASEDGQTGARGARILAEQPQTGCTIQVVAPATTTTKPAPTTSTTATTKPCSAYPVCAACLAVTLGTATASDYSVIYAQQGGPPIQSSDCSCSYNLACLCGAMVEAN